ncbi:hypothetical protein K5X82_01125 [Halosquirtibacter xylanolyticus]|uniref:fimbrillin family protein n=1 Tax=Halosquirtibacter xylanolyticus TaxID=3374599 RepID=UPI003748133B|nr:hypothetical protein K5X82_01125 [Prolixibacteraceae bacterium]
MPQENVLYAKVEDFDKRNNKLPIPLYFKPLLNKVTVDIKKSLTNSKVQSVSISNVSTSFKLYIDNNTKDKINLNKNNRTSFSALVPPMNRYTHGTLTISYQNGDIFKIPIPPIDLTSNTNYIFQVMIQQNNAYIQNIEINSWINSTTSIIHGTQND